LITDFHPNMAQVVHRQRHVIADVFAYCRNIFAKPVDALIGHLRRHERMGLLTQFPLALSRGLHDHARRVFDHVDAQIHLHPGDPHRLTFLGAPSILLRVVRLGRVRIDADLVPPLAAQHLVNRTVVDLAGNVPVL
jgi:hypothetical protein